MAQEILPSDINLNIKPEQINNLSNSIFYIIIGALVFGLLIYILWQWRQRTLHNIHVTIHKQVGDSIVVDEDFAMKQYTDDGNYIFHYFFSNKKSPVVDDKYMKIVKQYKFGLRLPFTTSSSLGFDAYYQDGKICPCEMNKVYNPETKKLESVSINGIDYDAFNFMSNEITAYQLKKQRVDKLLQLAPYALMVLVVIAFIVGMVLYTKHLETMSGIWLQSVQKSTESIIDKIGSLQVIPQG